MLPGELFVPVSVSPDLLLFVRDATHLVRKVFRGSGGTLGSMHWGSQTGSTGTLGSLDAQNSSQPTQEVPLQPARPLSAHSTTPSNRARRPKKYFRPGPASAPLDSIGAPTPSTVASSGDLNKAAVSQTTDPNARMSDASENPAEVLDDFPSSGAKETASRKFGNRN